MRTLNLLRLGLTLACVLLFAFAGVAHADANATASTGVQEDVAASEQIAASSESAGQAIDEGAASATPPPPSASPSDTADQGTVPAASPAPQAGTPAAASIAEAINAAVGQAAAHAQRSAGGEPDMAVAESNITSQLIWQVQISECIAHCSNTTQSQSADQQNSTGQTLAGTGQSAQGPDAHAQSSVSVTQIQYGCVAYCFGTSTTARTPIPGDYAQAIGELLREIVAGLPKLGAVSAAEQNAVEQRSFQSQTSPGDAATQTQRAEQSNATSQLYDTASLTGDEEQAAAGSRAFAPGVINQTEQGIWQLQIGCLLFCSETAQYQRAEQSNATAQSIIPAQDTASGTDADVTNVVSQVVWQAQIGCLYWCVDTTQQQIASTQDTLTVVEGDDAPPPPPAQEGVSPPVVGAEPEPPPTSGPARGEAARGVGGGPTDGSTEGGMPGPIPVATVSAAAATVRPRITPNVTRRRSAPSPRRAVTRANAPVRRDVYATAPALTALHANVQGAAAPAVRVPRISSPLTSLAGDAQPGSVGPAATEIPVATLLAVLALCALCGAGVGLSQARRASRPRRQGG